MIGTVLDGTYRVLERIGAGGMGEVYLVEHVHIGRREAIKVLRPELASDPRLASRFRREARAINRLRHPNIIGIYDFGQLPDGRLYLTMEYAAGEALDSVLQREGRLELPRALHVLHQLAAAIDHAHAQGVVHRDLKPNNLVLVEERGRPDTLKVLDFGLAKVVDPGGTDDKLTLLGELFGTPEYLAPERFSNRPDDPRSDLYAIGCVGFELLVGRPPFTGVRALVMAAHMQTPPPVAGRAVPGVPPMLDAILGQLLAKSPDQRLQSGAQLCAALEQVPGFPRKKSVWNTGGVLTTSSAPPSDERRGTEQMRAPNAMGFADTASARGEDVLDEIFGALVELARTTTEQCPGDEGLSIALAVVHGVRDDRARLIGERTDLEARQTRALQTAREREGSLRFAIAELRFVRQSSRATAEIAADLDYQIDALDQRVRELHAELHAELHRIDERGIELAAVEHDLQRNWLGLHRRLRVALSLRLLTIGAPAAALAGRFAVVGSAVDEILSFQS
jgi:tRNA A-37 threonylcarbamoyl transferase component Bud32